MTGPCVFCGIVAGEIEASVVDDDDDVVAFLDVQPITEGHTLVVPRRHYGSAADLDPRSADALWRAALRVAAALRRSGVRCEGVNFLASDGAAAGQEVPHLHLHVVPRYSGDGFGFRFPPAHAERPPRSELDATAKRIREAL